MGRLRVAVFNLENLFVRFDRPAPADVTALSEADWQRLTVSTVENKPLRSTIEAARAIQEIDPDLLLLCEVGGMESLRNFNERFLRDEYRPFLIEGNSERGIDLGYLLKRSLPFSCEVKSHKARELDFLYPHERLAKGPVAHRFSRDVLELRISRAAERDPLAVFLLVHLKSQLDRDRIDPRGRDRRKAELDKLVEIWREIDAEYGGRTPVFIGGDLNGHAAQPNPDAEFESLYRDTPLRDVLEMAERPLEERTTFLQIQKFGPSMPRQLDYLFAPPRAGGLIASETFVYRFQDHLGRTLLAPRNIAEKRLLPSDHYPLVATFALPDAIEVA